MVFLSKFVILYFIFFPVALGCLSNAAKLVHVSGHEGRDVNISCLYQQGYESYEKYLCKNDCSEDADVLIRSTEVKKDRYSTHDDKEKCIFVVTISGLSSMDAGKYWCGLTRKGYDSYPVQVHLEVQKGKKSIVQLLKLWKNENV